MRGALRLAQGAVAAVVLLAELGYLASVLWRQFKPADAPELHELARSAWAELERTAQYNEAIRRTLASIRNLPETGPDA